MEEQLQNELIKCQDPVYFYINYFRIKGDGGESHPPPPPTEDMKYMMRQWVGYKSKIE